MPAPATADEFLDVVRKSGLVPADRLAPLRPDAGVDQLAAGLIRAGLLTKFQARQLQAGRYRRFEVAGKYRLLELLGVGGMGAVYLCEHTLMRRLVAVKVLPADRLKDRAAVERFHREARAVAALDHPNIVRAHDIDRFDGLHFLVMEYVDGASLHELVARHGPLDPLRAAHYAAQAAEGLQHAHELGMVHRDVKPGNLLLDRTGTVKLLDLGLARFLAQPRDDVTARFDGNSVVGTADYLAPEQALANVVDTRADLYALGGTLYYLLTGSPPFPRGTAAEKLLAHQTREPEPVGRHRADVPADLQAVLHRLLRTDPAERYQTPAELAAALAPWTARPLPPPPAHEMPDLCPLVRSRVGHAVDRPRRPAARPAVTPPPALLDTDETPAGNAGRLVDTTPLPARPARLTTSAVDLLAPPPATAVPPPAARRWRPAAWLGLGAGVGFAAGFAAASLLAVGR